MSKLRAAQDLIDLFYPIGTYYETSNTSFNPNKEWGGTWKEDSNGLFLMAKNSNYPTIGATGGITNYTPSGSISGTSISMEQLPSQVLVRVNATHSENYGNNNWEGPRTGWGNYPIMNCPGCFGHSGQPHYHTFTGTTKNILPPYVVIKRWHRTA